MITIPGLLASIPVFLVVLTVVVFIHEGGHYLVARWNGVAIHTFSIGFGREIWGFTDRHGTRWRFSMIPLGGYVRFVGDMNPASLPDPDAADAVPPEKQGQLFVNKAVWQRLAVVVAGPIANIVFAFLILYALLLGYGKYTLSPVIDQVVAESVAEAAGLQSGDRVTSVDSFAVRGFEDFQRLVATAPERRIQVGVERDGQQLMLTMVPAATEITDSFGNIHRIGRIGVTQQTENADITHYRPDPVEAALLTVEEIRFIVDRTFAFIGDFFVGRGDFRQLGGPLEIADATGEAASMGPEFVVGLAALLSLNLGIFNLLPIPMLDGGHVVYYLAEAVRRRPLSQRVQEIGFRFGFAFLVSLLALVTVFNTIPAIVRGFS